MRGWNHLEPLPGFSLGNRDSIGIIQQGFQVVPKSHYTGVTPSERAKAGILLNWGQKGLKCSI